MWVSQSESTDATAAEEGTQEGDYELSLADDAKCSSRIVEGLWAHSLWKALNAEKEVCVWGISSSIAPGLSLHCPDGYRWHQSHDGARRLSTVAEYCHQWAFFH